jgi:hypothetical protein
LSAAKATFCGAATARDAEAGVSLEIKMVSGNKALESQSSGYHRGAQTAPSRYGHTEKQSTNFFSAMSFRKLQNILDSGIIT